MLIGVVHESFPATMVMMILSGIFLEAGCGATYGVVPFVSRRSTGIVCGLVSAGGACGGVINQALFFLNTPAKGAYGECFMRAALDPAKPSPHLSAVLGAAAPGPPLPRTEGSVPRSFEWAAHVLACCVALRQMLLHHIQE